MTFYLRFCTHKIRYPSVEKTHTLLQLLQPIGVATSEIAEGRVFYLQKDTLFLLQNLI